MESFIEYNNSNDSDINETLHNVDVSSVTGLLNSHTLPQPNESSKFNELDISVDNGGFNGDYCYMNSSNGSVIRNHNSFYYKNKRDEIYTNKYLRLNNGLPDGVDIDYLLPASVPNKYVNMKYNNEHHKLQSDGKIST